MFMHLIQVIHPVPKREQYFSREQKGLQICWLPILQFYWWVGSFSHGRVLLRSYHWCRQLLNPRARRETNIFQTRYIILVLLVYDILTNPLHNILKERSVFSYADLNHFVIFQTTSSQNICCFMYFMGHR